MCVAARNYDAREIQACLMMSWIFASRNLPKHDTDRYITTLHHITYTNSCATRTRETIMPTHLSPLTSHLDITLLHITLLDITLPDITLLDYIGSFLTC